MTAGEATNRVRRIARRAISVFLCLVLIAATLIDVLGHAVHLEFDHHGASAEQGSHTSVATLSGDTSHTASLSDANHDNEEHHSRIPGHGSCQDECHAHVCLLAVVGGDAGLICDRRGSVFVAAAEAFPALLFGSLRYRPPITHL